jgi:NTP pyrophosphatase (non-canonical NTP hydrolase)
MSKKNKNKKKPLTFSKLRKTNVKRCVSVFHALDEWSLSEWSNAMAGETGEACNVTKKILRGDKPLVEYKKDLAKEIADVICYADLLAAAAGIDLEKAVIEKFNEVSDRRQCKIKL